MVKRTIVIEDKRKEPTTPGYASSGESSFTRHAAQGHPVDTATRDHSNRSASRLDLMVTHERKVIERLERRAAEARGGDKYPMICVRLQRTRLLLARLEAEQREIAGGGRG